MSRLGDLTIVIPSFGRQDFLTRQISYWSASEVNLLILDGSERAMPLGSLPSRVNYVHMPTDFFQRMQAAADYVTTPYAALLGVTLRQDPQDFTDCPFNLGAGVCT
ncbi:MAG: hypothetical protein EBY74_07430 [Actinobacteria bacterium]|nr:hypothetical protein [Actinomycetota bacterium]